MGYNSWFGGEASGIFSTTAGSLSGDLSGSSGTITLDATDSLTIKNGGRISSSSEWNGGDAGQVIVESDKITIHGQDSGIFSSAGYGSLGRVGAVSILGVSISMGDQAQISIAANQTLLPPESILSEISSNGCDSGIFVTTNQLHIDQEARITAESKGNVPAASIDLNVNEFVLKNNSCITTSAQAADGGPITIQGSSILVRDSQITTSVEGLSGDGGNITITGRSQDSVPEDPIDTSDNQIECSDHGMPIDDNPADVLALDGGFIQANTAAENARGGDIRINTRSVIAQKDKLFVGGEKEIEFDPEKGINGVQLVVSRILSFEKH
ncbi:MAG: hypothetical protein U9P10_01945 [Thermodesulfobacteriota bacterium]|nr:hypothetical protein [Thermodesulfobacteriota bacterium]